VEQHGKYHGREMKNFRNNTRNKKLFLIIFIATGILCIAINKCDDGSKLKFEETGKNVK
jgi:hypothetical protein